MSRDVAPAPFSGPPPAFTRFVDERRDGLIRFAMNLGISADDAKDLVQEGLLRLMRYCDNTPVNEWTPLIYRIVLNLHRDRQRQLVAQGTPMAGSDEILQLQPSQVASPERQASDHQQLALARAAILGLPPKCREVYLLNRMDGLSYPAIAQRCGISVKAVEKHISRALGELRRKVDRGPSEREDS